MKKIIFIFFIGAFLMIISSCHKEFLEIRSDTSITIPNDISDYQAILDNARPLMNLRAPVIFQIIGGEEFYLQSNAWHGFPTTSARFQQKSAYIWADDIYGSDVGTDWNNGYERILNANIVLDGLKNMNEHEKKTPEWSHTYGSALFFRAWNYFMLAQSFCQIYDSNNLDKPGLPLRLEADVTIPTVRSTIGQTYKQIINDVLESIEHLPEQSNIKTRPSKTSSYALLARIYLQINDYDKALHHADLALNNNDNLIDYNQYRTVGANGYPFVNNLGSTNEEIIFYDAMSIVLFNMLNFYVNDNLWNLYEEGDLRKNIFFSLEPSGGYKFRGTYTGTTSFFVGITTAELMLIRAEIYARNGREDLAREEILKIWKKRYLIGSNIPLIQETGTNLLQLIFNERRKELVFRGLRWSDLRRLNAEKEYQVVLERKIDNQIYKIEPGSYKYTWPIPPDVISLTGIPQNPR